MVAVSSPSGKARRSTRGPGRAAHPAGARGRGAPGAGRGRCWSASRCSSRPAPTRARSAFASRRAGEPWFCFEQPDRDGAALATVGRVRGSRRAARRFARAATAWRELAGRAEADPPDGPAGAGLVAVGGFAFAPDGGAAPHWGGSAPAS